MKTLSIPAAQNGVDGVYTENVAEPGIAVIAATASFFVSLGNQQKFKITNGQRLGAASGPALGRITFSNPTATAVTVTIGNFDSVVTAIAPDLVNVSGVTNITNPMPYGFWDTTLGGASPFASNPALALDPNKPFRRIWCYFDASTFPDDSVVSLDFYKGATLVLVLPVWYKLAGPTNVGFSMNPTSDNGSRVPGASDLFYKPTSGATVYRLPPFDVRAIADSVKFVNDLSGGTVTGNMRAFLSIFSAEEKF